MRRGRSRCTTKRGPSRRAHRSIAVLRSREAKSRDQRDSPLFAGIAPKDVLAKRSRR
jgi:hypothetical protein